MNKYVNSFIKKNKREEYNLKQNLYYRNNILYFVCYRFLHQDSYKAYGKEYRKLNKEIIDKKPRDQREKNEYQINQTARKNIKIIKS